MKGNITPKFGLTLLMQYPVRDENRGDMGETIRIMYPARTDVDESKGAE